MRASLAAAAGIAALTLSHGFAQKPCGQDTTLSGVVRDSTAALIPGAQLSVDGKLDGATDAAGSFRIPCLAKGTHHLVVTATDFASRILTVTTPRSAALDITMEPATVDTNIDVDAADSEGAANSANAAGPTETIAGKRLQSLADDPDDLLRELQQMAAASGGNPSNTTISVDGFQESTTLPPKSSIAYIKVNPDMFSAEYREPPFDGGRVEVYTKPGQKTYHGALFATNGSPWENARDPFSTSKASLGKQRYGFELTGPVRPRVRHGEGADFALNLEHRSIDNDAVVDAFTLDANGDAATVVQNVPTPQRLWIGLARLDWQLGAKNTFTASYGANVNHLQNVGVGGETLAEGGYDSEKYDHMIRFSDVTTVDPHVMNEARLSLHITRQSYLPASTAPQVAVAGAFTGGGNTLGAQQAHWFNIEADDDAIVTTKHHTLKFGTQTTTYIEHRQLPTDFNGAYTFGGGTAPVLDANNQPTGQTETITGIEQYRRALLGLAGGTPTAYTSVTGTPTVDFTQLWGTLFIQDDWNLGHGLHIATGVRYFVETHPNAYNGIVPRVGVLWSPTKKGTWTLHAHFGVFSAILNDSTEAEVLRENGTSRVTTTVYHPVYGDPMAGATPIYSMREYSPHLNLGSYSISNIGGTGKLGHGWNLSLDYYTGRFWDIVRTENINSPLNGSPTGPRFLGIPNSDILQTQNSAQGRADVVFGGIEQHSLKHLQLFFGGVRVNIVSDEDNSDLFTPQSAFTDAGEFAHRSNQGVWQLFGNATLTLPKKLQLSADYHGSGDTHYNVTTGFDNNGDGDFNDRPMYAAAGSTAATPGVYATRYGLLTTSGIPGVTPGNFLPRDVGVMPWTIYLDMNLQRAFALNSAKAVHPQTLTLNVRSANVLNHLNVTSVGGVLGSPQFGIPYAADNGRRVELGARYTF